MLLPVPYFLVTFTVPEPLRLWMRSHPDVSLDLLFAASAHALQDLARNPQRLGASLGMLGLLHTWSRTLIYHPHVHYLVPAGGLSLDQRQWVPSRPKFLVHVHPLADHYRTLFRQGLQRDAPDLLKTLP
ncbi:MAG: transposase, partial [Verrucomicrobia bacterium]|nr:transposase [Verrucomicrobiota bacterium]